MLDVHIVFCSRCGMPCKLADTATEEARLLKKQTQPGQGGYCADCAVTDFMVNWSHLAELMAMNPAGKQMLLDPRIQREFARLLSIGHADATPAEINWQRVYDNWDLPCPKRRVSRKGGRKP